VVGQCCISSPSPIRRGNDEKEVFDGRYDASIHLWTLIFYWVFLCLALSSFYTLNFTGTYTLD
jgi:hypothetical protein